MVSTGLTKGWWTPLSWTWRWRKHCKHYSFWSSICLIAAPTTEPSRKRRPRGSLGSLFLGTRTSSIGSLTRGSRFYPSSSSRWTYLCLVFHVSVGRPRDSSAVSGCTKARLLGSRSPSFGLACQGSVAWCWTRGGRLEGSTLQLSFLCAGFLGFCILPSWHGS